MLVNPKDCMTVEELLQHKPSQKMLMEKVRNNQFDSLAHSIDQVAWSRIKEQTLNGASSWMQPTFVQGQPAFPLLIVRHLGGEFKASASLSCPRSSVVHSAIAWPAMNKLTRNSCT
jgi:hypothetical protein